LLEKVDNFARHCVNFALFSIANFTYFSIYDVTGNELQINADFDLVFVDLQHARGHASLIFPKLHHSSKLLFCFGTMQFTKNGSENYP
jgi:hypothetical protein